jgi:serine/threonine protein kinase
MIETWKGYTSVVERVNEDVVRKRFKQKFMWMIKREVEALRRLSKYKNFPKIVSVQDKYIDISYCGVQTKELDREQCLEILLALKETRIVHRDIIPRNLLKREKNIYLIDFGWCLFDGEKESPIIPPKGLGLRYYKHNKWDDEKAMKIIFSEINL